MKKLIFLLLFIFIYSCDSGPVEPTIVVQSQEDLLKEEMRFKRRIENRNKRNRNITKNALEKQKTQRQFIRDTDSLNNTDDTKIAYYLDIALNAEKAFAMDDAKKYAKKVLDLDPQNSEAKRIYYKFNKMMHTINADGSKDAQIKRQLREQKELMQLGKKASTNSLYKSAAQNKVDAYLRKQKYDVKMDGEKVRVIRR